MTSRASNKTKTAGGDESPSFLNSGKKSTKHDKGSPVKMRALGCVHYSEGKKKRVALPKDKQDELYHILSQIL